MISPADLSVFDRHPLGRPNRACRAYRVDTNHGHAYFSTGNYSQHSDPRIITITRMLYPSHHASHFLATFRRYLRTHTKYLAVATHTDPAHNGTHLIADRWVFSANHRGKRRWLRTL